MEMVIKISRLFYGLAMIAYGIQQFVYADFRNVFLPSWQSELPLLAVWAFIFGAVLVATGVAIIVQKKAREACLILGTILLVLFCFVHVPYELIDPHSYNKHFGSWVNSLKEVALSGGAFVMADSFQTGHPFAQRGAIFLKALERIAPSGKILFSLVMASFGVGHFMYMKYLTQLVPASFPDHLFWVCFAGTALTGAGVFIVLDIRTKVIAILLGFMIFLWVLLVHLPSAIANPFSNRGNEVSSAFDALAFSGIAFVIALSSKQKVSDNID